MRKQGKLSGSTSVASPDEPLSSSSPSSSASIEDKAPQALGSRRLQLLQNSKQRNKNESSDKRARNDNDSNSDSCNSSNNDSKRESLSGKPESTIVQIEAPSLPPPSPSTTKQQQKQSLGKETTSSIAKVIKRKLGFFRKSASTAENKTAKKRDVQAPTTTTTKTTVSEPRRENNAPPTVDVVVVDVHRESNDDRKKQLRSGSKRDIKTTTTRTTSILGGTTDDSRLVGPKDQRNEPSDNNGTGISNHSYDNSDNDDNDNKKVSKILRLSTSAALAMPADYGDEDNDNNLWGKSSASKVSPSQPATAAYGDARKRKRWDESEVAVVTNAICMADDDPRKPRRRQWAKQGSANAQIHNATGSKITVPVGRATTAVTATVAAAEQRTRKSARPKSAANLKPEVASRTKSSPLLQEEQLRRRGGYDNDGFSSDHDDEILRIETVDNKSPQIKIGHRNNTSDDDQEYKENGDGKVVGQKIKMASDRKIGIKEIKEYTIESAKDYNDDVDNDDGGNKRAESQHILTSANVPSPLLPVPSFGKAKALPLAKRCSTSDRCNRAPVVKGKLDDHESQEKVSKKRIGEEKEEQEDEEEEEEEDEDEQETVLNIGQKKSRRLSDSSRIEIMHTKISYGKGSSDETTISTNEEMYTSRRDHSSRLSLRGKPKSSKSSTRLDEAEEESNNQKVARAKRKTTSSSIRNSAEEIFTLKEARRKNKSRKKARRSKTKGTAIRTSLVTRESDTVEKEIRKMDENDDDYGDDRNDGTSKYVSVKVHKCDMLEADCVTKHPMVRVHVIYEDSGDYLPKQHLKNESEEINNEKKEKEQEEEKKKQNDQQLTNDINNYNNNNSNNGNNCNDRLSPLMTDKFDFKRRKTMVPVWEEELVFELNYKDLFAGGRNSVLILFEVLDLLSSAEKSLTSDQFLKDMCWHKVAWAFLRPVGVSGARHVDKKCRLQLYRPKKSFRRSIKHGNKCEVYKWWRSTGSKDKYPSSLYVTITGVKPLKPLEPLLYEQLLEIREMKEPQSERSVVTARGTGEKVPEPPKWTRQAAQSCQIPNEIYQETDPSSNGCFFLAFSNDGKYLACALSEEYEFPINVYKINEGNKVNVQFAGHKNFIYSLNWSWDDRYLLSVSSDQTARLWDVQEKIIEPIHALPHPSYVYCGKFAPKTSNCIVTGCYDHVARVWARSRFSQQYELVQELEGHESFVNAICFQPTEQQQQHHHHHQQQQQQQHQHEKEEEEEEVKKGKGSRGREPEAHCCLTADGLGCIIVWLTRGSRRSSLGWREWRMERKIKIKEIEGVPINWIAIHPLIGHNRLMVHSRNSGMRLVDASDGSLVKEFKGLYNQRIQLTACISPCGGLLFCGGEDSSLKVWSMETGKLVATYDLGIGGGIIGNGSSCQNSTLTCVDYHPYDHVLAFAIYGVPEPVKILKFDRESSGENVGLKLVAATGSSFGSLLGSRPKEHPLLRNGGTRNIELSDATRMNLNTLAMINTNHHQATDYSYYSVDDHGNISEERNRHLKGKLQRFVESGPGLKSRSMTRLNGIIEKIDRILMYATTSQKSPAPDDLELGNRPSSSRSATEVFQLLPTESRHRRTSHQVDEIYNSRSSRSSSCSSSNHQNHHYRRRQNNYHQYRSTSARNAVSSSAIRHETEFSKALSDSAALYSRKVSRFSDNSSNSSSRSLTAMSHPLHSPPRRHGRREEFTLVPAVPTAETALATAIVAVTESTGLTNSLDTIVDGKEDFPSEEILDVESLKSDDTYVVTDKDRNDDVVDDINYDNDNDNDDNYDNYDDDDDDDDDDDADDDDDDADDDDDDAGDNGGGGGGGGGDGGGGGGGHIVSNRVTSSGNNDYSDRSNATFVIECELPPVPKPRTKSLESRRIRVTQTIN